ncbi:MAG: hypothetical protein K2K82_07755 [Muribaculaceae bacterium]|nr:hypothetical protein [Muribaculaceae bacterium]
MKLIAEISIGADGKLKYAGGLTADKEPLNEATSTRFEVLTMVHEDIKEVIDEINDSLPKELTDKLATPNYDEYGNPKEPSGYGIRIIN